MIELNRLLVERAVWDACANWVRWREDFEAPLESRWADRPVLKCPSKFEAFCDEYGLKRTIHPKTTGNAKCARNELRLKVANSTPPELAQEVELWRASINEVDFKYCKESPLGISMSSKLLCFRNPVLFPPMDTFNRKGMKYLTTGNRPKNAPNFSYKVFASEFRKLHSKPSVIEVFDPFILAVSGIKVTVERLRARALDLYLMMEGGYGPPA